MHVLVVRHAIAEDGRAIGERTREDAARPLTKEGRRKMARGVLGLRRLVPEIDLLASSPLRRAIETADIIAGAYDGLRVKRVVELAPGSGVDRVIEWLRGKAIRGTIAVVGHEPDLSFTVCALLCGANNPFLELRKGAACLLECRGRVARGAATLEWLIQPKQLRQLGADID